MAVDRLTLADAARIMREAMKAEVARLEALRFEAVEA